MTPFRAVGVYGLAAVLTVGCERELRFDERGDAAGADGGGHDAAAGHDAGATPPGPCASDADCGLSSLHCDLGTHACVECTEQAHCAGRLDLPICDVDEYRYRCVQCAEGVGPGTGCADDETCVSDHCVSTCAGRIDCSLGTECGPSGACECEDEHCRDTGATSLCDEARGYRCVECAGDGHCGSQHCDPVLGRCVECVDSSDCSDPPWCDPVTHQCVTG